MASSTSCLHTCMLSPDRNDARSSSDSRMAGATEAGGLG